jgi:hypothetical protein
MLGDTFRPWGQAHWVFGHLPRLSWSFLGCVGVEERSLGAWEVAVGQVTLRGSFFLEIGDPPSRFSAAIRSKIEDRRTCLQVIGQPDEVKSINLFCSLQQLFDLIDPFFAGCSEDLIIDTSSFPKRFFFPIVKRAKLSGRFRNLMLMYTVPQIYTMDALSEDPEPWRELPYFMTNMSTHSDVRLALIGVGFLPMSLPEVLVDQYPEIEVRLLMPFPAGPFGFNRNWQFIRELQDSFPRVASPVRVDARDVPDVFDHLCAITAGGARKSILAPYGPKPLSIAFCLFAIETDSPVFYTQPRVYHPDYSEGIAQIGGLPLVMSYVLRMQETDLYRVR